MPGSGTRIAVVTDSAAALPDTAGGTHGATAVLPGTVSTVQMPVMINDRIFSEDEVDLTSTLAIALAEGKRVVTSRPSPGQFEAKYRELKLAGFTGAVSIHLSGALSGTVDAARLASRRVDFPVEVLDSRTVAMAMGYGVIAAAEEAAKGSSLAVVADRARKMTAETNLYFYVPSLDQLRRGGRIGPAAGWIGMLLAVKPILQVVDGGIVLLEKARTAPRAVGRLVEIVVMDALARSGTPLIAVHHFGNEEQASAVVDELLAHLPEVDIVQSRLPAVLAAHGGLGAVAIAVASSVVAAPADSSTSPPQVG
ncbi:DegV family protein [Arthrobacter roseus]